VDVRESHVTLDILSTDVKQENIIGKERAILERLAGISGVTLAPGASVHSNGILGLICLEPDDDGEMAARVAQMTEQIKSNIAKRAIVFPTGFELKQGLIEDTNTPYLKALLEASGYRVDVGEILDDCAQQIAASLDDALSRAYGLIITTGGVGAEDKDKSVEALLAVEPGAATPYIVKFKVGTGRHVKDGVRIGVGQVGPSVLVTLPGPNDEVRIAAGILLDGLGRGAGKEELATKIAGALSAKLAHKPHQPHN